MRYNYRFCDEPSLPETVIDRHGDERELLGIVRSMGRDSSGKLVVVREIKILGDKIDRPTLVLLNGRH